MPTAPRNPTQETKAFSRHEKRNGVRHKITASGRAKNISVAATASAGIACSNSRSGEASRPSSTNITICASQVAASRNTMIVLWARVGRLPTIIPAR